jgi:hypothetical protein
MALCRSISRPVCTGTVSPELQQTEFKYITFFKSRTNFNSQKKVNSAQKAGASMKSHFLACLTDKKIEKNRDFLRFFREMTR